MNNSSLLLPTKPLAMPVKAEPSIAGKAPVKLPDGKVPEILKLPVNVAPVDVISNLVLPWSCNLILPVPAEFIIESVVLWKISKSLPVP